MFGFGYTKDYKNAISDYLIIKGWRKPDMSFYFICPQEQTTIKASYKIIDGLKAFQQEVQYLVRKSEKDTFEKGVKS